MYQGQTDYLEEFADILDSTAIQSLRKAKAAKRSDPAILPYQEAVQKVSHFSGDVKSFDDSWVTIGDEKDLSPPDREILLESLKAFIPWKKGPFRIFGEEIDAEWRSDLKWNRFHSHLGSLKNQKICDIGCHNGYFMFRMAAANPKLVIGLEPYAKHYYNFMLMQQFAKVPSLYFELLGVEDIHVYKEFFDKIFCLGILYHHTDPVGLLRKIHSSLVPHGDLYIDCQGIPGDEPVALVPRGRYARARGIWFLPTASCLENWLRRSQFKDIECIFAEPLDQDEQRTTVWAPIDSLSSFLDPNDKTKTIEGYPAPWRFYFKARRG